MDITSTPTNTNTNTNTNTKSPETGSPDHHQTGTTRIQTAKHLTFTNGVLKRHRPTGGHHQQLRNQHYHHHQHYPIVITYKECLKNHAASLGGHALDGCGEFMPSPIATATDPTSLKCAACGCHRNFHRREPEDSNTNAIINSATATAATHLSNNPITNANTTATIEYQPHHRHHPPPPQPQRSPGSSSPPPISSSYYPSAPHMLLALSGNLQSAQENMNMIAGMNMNVASSSGRKRFRTKFSQSQKERMHQFAERVGWKMQKRDEETIQEFCNEVGVDRTVLKVWMHNNKNTFGKRDLNNGGSSGGGGGRINLDDHDNTRSNNNNNGSKNGRGGGGGDHEEEEEEDSKNINDNNNSSAATAVQNLNHHFESESVAHVATANGSSSSS